MKQRAGKIVTALACLLLFAAQAAQSDEFSELMSGLANLSSTASIGSLEEYISKHPRHAMARFELARAYISAKQPSLAEDQLRSCMELSSVGTDLHNNCIASLKEISQSKLSGTANTGPRSGEHKASGSNQTSGTTSQAKGVVQNYAAKVVSTKASLTKTGLEQFQGNESAAVKKAGTGLKAKQ